jgi:aspartate carbamoyltransferase
MENHPFAGRTISVVNDLSIDEQMYLYEQTRNLKRAIRNGDSLAPWQINNPQVGAYLIFLESSTRTKESFLNAVKFHNIKTNIFDTDHSSFNKSESYADTLKMLAGYSERSIFIMRTKLEGVGRWLEVCLGQYADKMGLPAPAFLNGGDGKHEHPTQEFLDEYTFLEQNDFQREHIHLALIGDLTHGRTVHSKADGLHIFKEVEVDLIAPEELGLPEHYYQKMLDNGYKIRNFESIDAYLTQKDIAKSWYFTRLQLERMGEDILEKADRLHKSVTFNRDFLPKLPENVRFYHPLPRHKVHPTIPFWLDTLPLNGWEEQAINGYYTRIVEIGMLSGKIGEDFQGLTKEPKDYHDDFIETVPAFNKKKPEYKIGTKPVENGIVIDHIGKGNDIETIWEQISKIRKILNLNVISSSGVYRSHVDGLFKGVLSLPDLDQFGEIKMKKLSAIAPESTLNIVKDYVVQEKYRVHMPPRIYDFEDISCKNPDCISHPAHHENAITEFYRTSSNKFICKYCERIHTFEEIWNY